MKVQRGDVILVNYLLWALINSKAFLFVRRVTRSQVCNATLP